MLIAWRTLSFARFTACGTAAIRHRPRKSIALAIAAITCVAGPVIGLQDGGPPSARSVAEAETPRINRELSAQSAPFMLLLGDSNGDGIGKLWSDCAMPVVNAAIGGLKALDVDEHLQRLQIDRPPAVSVIVVGTNDLLWKHEPSAKRELWLGTVRSIILRLNRLGSKVVVSAVAPLSSKLDHVFDLKSIKAYSAGLSEMCDDAPCTFVDPWTEARAESFGEAKSDAVPDGLHIGDYRHSVKKIAQHVCSRLEP